MDFDKLIARAAADLAAAESTRKNYVTEQETLLRGVAADASLTEADQARFEELGNLKRGKASDIDALRVKVASLRAEQADDARLERAADASIPAAQRTAPAVVRSEPRTYSSDSARKGASFFSDLYRSQFSGDIGARDRVERHRQEVTVEGEAQRAIVTGTLNSLIPPVYLADEFAALARSGRPTANLVRHAQLPDGGMSIVIPRGTGGTSAAIQSTQNSPVANVDLAITDLTVPVVTIAGQQDVSRQALERGTSVDTLIYGDLAADYAVKLNTQVLSGTGAAGQMLGILSTAGITQTSAFAAAATITSFYSKLAGAVSSILTGRFFAPTGIVVHPRRLGWLISSVDNAGRPVFLPNMNAPLNAVGISAGVDAIGTTDPAGWIQGIPVYVDASLPTAVGAASEDQVLVVRLADLILWEDGNGTPTELRFEQTAGGSLTTKLVLYGYAAFTAGRYPASTAVIGGNSALGFGLIAPTF